MKAVLSLYGNVTIKRGMCPECKEMAFIIHGCFACCGLPANATPKKFERMSEPVQHRKRPKKVDQDRILAEQDNRCFYCDCSFNLLRFKNGKPVALKINWDHQLPYSLTQNNNAVNFVAACHVCNGIKSDKVFQTVEEAKIYIADRRKSKGYNF